MSSIEAPDITRKAEAEAAEPQLQSPPLYRVVMLNDDFTPMDFVVDILMRFFHQSEERATQMMLQIHHEGSTVCGIYPRDIAETKLQQVVTASRTSGHPLRCIMEHDSDD
jgi:ATP-dependent Clp protease adaptor protein ClpS